MITEVCVCAIRVRNALFASAALSRLCRCRVLFPDIGLFPVVFEVAFERFAAEEPYREFPAVDQVVEHLAGLTTL